MKKLSKALILCLLLMGVLGLAACQQKTADQNTRTEVPDLISQQPQTSVTAYFKSQDGDMLVPLSFGINSSRDTVWIALEKLLAGPPDSFVDAVVPQGIKIKDLYFANDTVNISLTGDIALSPEDINLDAFFATVNLELISQDDTTASLLIYYNDEQLLDEPYYGGIVNDFGGGDNGSYVYFEDSQAMYLVPLCLPIYASDYDSDSAFFGALFAAWAGDAPEGSNLYSALASDVELLGVDLQDNLLTLNFNSKLLEIGGMSQEHMLIESILAMLSPYEQVTEVQILVEGEAVSFLPHGTDISIPLSVDHDFYIPNKVNQ
jgi:spore germination protein GerM